MKESLVNSASDFHECYVVVEILEIVHDQRQFRLEVVEAIHRTSNHFDVNAYEMKDDAWIRWTDFPWIERDSADSALAQALSFLKDRTGLR